MSDPFGTATLREAALAAWSRSPARFREDANAEEDHARGYYRDRVVVELAQNAADAAARAGEPGRLLLALRRTDGPPGTPSTTVLVAANSGSPLDAEGVASLASLRASAKRGGASSGTVGRFGVGFAAVRSVSDAVLVATAVGAVRFDLGAARAAVARAAADVPGLAAELAARGDGLPVLRLPFPAGAPDAGELDAGALDAVVADLAGGARPDPPGPTGGPGGWSTVVALALRDDAAVAAVRAQLADVDDALLLALPALGEVRVEAPDEAPRVVRDVDDRWVVARRAGEHDPALLADRPVEERDRRAWQVTWAVRRDAPTSPGPVHAPTPTDEPCSVPALLVATLPLDPTRRRVAPGPVTDALVGHAGGAWADLVATLRRTDGAPDPLDLLPAALPAGALDAALGAAVLDATRRSPVLPAADGGPALAPAEAVVLAGPGADVPALVAALAPHVPALADVPPARRRAAVHLGATQADLADLVDALPPDAALPLLDAAGADAGVLERLATLPVPLADGRVVRGARGLVVPRGVPEDVLPTLARWGVRIVAARAVHPGLERLGARVAGPEALLREAAVREAVLAGDAAAADVLLPLAAALGDGTGGDEPDSWWGDLLLPTADGDEAPARELVLPGSDAERWLTAGDLTPVADDVARRWGGALVRLGVRAGLVVVRALPGDEPPEPLDGWDDYLELLGDLAGTDVAALDVDLVPAVADLDAVGRAAWGEVLAHLAGSTARASLVERVRLPVAGRVVEAPSYTAWWLRDRSPLDLPPAFALPGAGRVAAELLGGVPPALAGLDEQAQRALGGVSDLAELDVDAWDEVLADLAGRRPGAPVDPAVALAVWRGLRADPGAAPGLVPAVTGSGVRLVAVDDVAVADPMWAQHPAVAPCVVVPAADAARLAEALDVDDAPARTPGRVTSRGAVVPVPEAVTRLWPGAPASYVEHDPLTVDGAPVDWWVVDGVAHAATPRGVADALAALVGWAERDAVARVLAGEAPDDVLLARAGDDA